MTSLTSLHESDVRVTAHALERARERHGDLRGLTERELRRRIRSEVARASAEGRKGKTIPREALVERDDRQKLRRGTTRFVWTAARHRVYVVAREGGITLVVTTLATVLAEA